MNKIPTLFNTYIWLIDTINRTGHITLEEINDRWIRTEQSGGESMHRNTFRRHLDNIEEMFDICIECDPRTYSYHIGNKSGLRQNSLKRWMLSTMSVAGAVRESRSMQNRILLESVPSGDLFLMEVTRAMESGRTLKVRYQKFVDAEPYECELEPYCLKLFHQRWYLLAHRTDRTYLAIYALDRMTYVTEGDGKFQLPEDFDAERYFSTMYGVYQPAAEEKAVKVVLRTYKGEWNYLRTLPLHPSQVEIVNGKQGTCASELGSLDNTSPCKNNSKQGPCASELDSLDNPRARVYINKEEHVDFYYVLFPTLDFKLDLLSRGDLIEVLAPESLRQNMKEMIHLAAKRYE